MEYRTGLLDEYTENWHIALKAYEDKYNHWLGLADEFEMSTGLKIADHSVEWSQWLQAVAKD